MAATITPASTASVQPWRTPIVLIRISSILFVGLMLGHMSAYPWTSARVAQETTLVESMQSTPFEFLSQRSTYWDLYFGWGAWSARCCSRWQPSSGCWRTSRAWARGA